MMEPVNRELVHSFTNERTNVRNVICTWTMGSWGRNKERLLLYDVVDHARVFLVIMARISIVGTTCEKRRQCRLERGNM